MSGTLTQADSIPANQTISVFFTGILGLFTNADGAAAAIKNAFAGTRFVVEAVNIPTLSEIETPDVVGHFLDWDGGDHSLPNGTDISVPDFENFFLGIMQTVDGLYNAGIAHIDAGAITPGLLPNSASGWTVAILAGLAVIALIVLLRTNFNVPVKV